VENATVRIKSSMGSGTGIIIDRQGYVLTANHVVETLPSVTVLHASGRQERGLVVGRDEIRDLAMIKISGRLDLPVVTLGNVANVKVGDRVLALGYPGFSERLSVTGGSISALLPQEVNEFSIVQTDAALYAGLSGGPLITPKGEVIAISVSSPALQAGFAIAIDDNTLQIVSRLKAGELILKPSPPAFGLTKQNPAPVSHTVRVIGPPSYFGSVTLTIHEITVAQVYRGAAANEFVAGTYQYNPPPLPGMEYMLALIRIRYVQGPLGETDWVHQVDFRLLSGGGLAYDYPLVVPVMPFLSAQIYPGAVFEAWTTWEVAIADKNPTLVWGLDWFSRNVAFFSLSEGPLPQRTPSQGAPTPEARYSRSDG
jgi:hypothetical protein